MVALILADGDVPTLSYLEAHWPWWFDDVELVVAADGGARHASALDVAIDLWVGDGDSIDPSDLAALADAGVEIERAPTDKDETDTELAIRTALARDTGGVIVIGATGGPRIDHELANIALLAMPELIGNAAILYTPFSQIRLLRGTGLGPSGTTAWRANAAEARRSLSLVPFGADADRCDDDLGFDTRCATPSSRSAHHAASPTSIEAVGQVSIREGLLLIIETPATIDG